MNEIIKIRKFGAINKNDSLYTVYTYGRLDFHDPLFLRLGQPHKNIYFHRKKI